MKSTILLPVLITLLLSCGKGKIAPDIATPSNDGFVPVAQLYVCVGNDGSCNELNAFYKAVNFLNPIAMAYASMSPTATITYTAAISGTATLAALPPVDATNPAEPNFGAIGLTTFDSNDLKKCGPLLNQKCTQAVVRAYATSRSSGFVTEGAIIRINGLEILDGVNNATILATGNIGSRNRIRNSPAGQNPFGGAQADVGDLTLDLYNASYGTYSATIVIELAIGPV